MEQPRLILRRRLQGDNFHHRVAQYVRRQAELAAEDNGIGDHGKVRHSSALREFADALERLSVWDQNLVALQAAQDQVGLDHGYKPPRGGEQATLIARYGMDDAPPAVAVVLGELVAAAVEDANERVREVQRVERAELARNREQLSQLADLDGRRVKAEATVSELTARLGQQGGELAHLRDRVAFLSLVRPEKAKERQRRVKVEGQERIYSSERADGSTVYEVGWREPDDRPEARPGDTRQRWETTGENVEDAIALRDETSKEGVTASA